MSLQYFKIANRILDRNRVVSVDWYRRPFMGFWQRSKPYQVAIEYEGLPPAFFTVGHLAFPMHSILRDTFGTNIFVNFATEKEAQDAAAKAERLRIKEFAE